MDIRKFASDARLLLSNYAVLLRISKLVPDGIDSIRNGQARSRNRLVSCRVSRAGLRKPFASAGTGLNNQLRTTWGRAKAAVFNFDMRIIPAYPPHRRF